MRSVANTRMSSHYCTLRKDTVADIFMHVKLPGFEVNSKI